MKFAPIYPPSALHLSPADYHLVFAERIVQDAQYEQAVHDHARRGMIIVDSMVYEGQAPISLDTVLQAAVRCNAQMAICPDFRGDMWKTLRAFREAYDSEAYAKVKRDVDLVGVAQGTNADEMIECATIMATRARVIALPFRFISGMPIPRIYIVQQLVQRGIFDKSGYTGDHRCRLHLLGAASHTFYEEALLAKYPFIIGCDSSKPVCAGLRLRDIRFCSDEHTTRQEDFMTAPEDIVIECGSVIRHNIMYVRGLLDGTWSDVSPQRDTGIRQQGEPGRAFGYSPRAG